MVHERPAGWVPVAAPLLRFAWATLAYGAWALYAVEGDDGDAFLGWTLTVDLLMACHAGFVFRRVAGGARWAAGAIALSTVLGLVAAFLVMPRPTDDGGLAALVYAVFGLLHLLLAAPMAYLAVRIVRRSQRRFPLETARPEPSLPGRT